MFPECLISSKHFPNAECCYQPGHEHYLSSGPQVIPLDLWRLFDYPISSPCANTQALGVWHIKKEEGRNDFVRRTNNEQEQEQIGHLWGAMGMFLTSSLEKLPWSSHPAGSKSPISSANISAVLIKSSELVFLGKWKWWQLLEPLNGHKSRAGLTPDLCHSFCRRKWAAYPAGGLGSLL